MRMFVMQQKTAWIWILFNGRRFISWLLLTICHYNNWKISFFIKVKYIWSRIITTTPFYLNDIMITCIKFEDFCLLRVCMYVFVCYTKMMIQKKLFKWKILPFFMIISYLHHHHIISYKLQFQLQLYVYIL